MIGLGYTVHDDLFGISGRIAEIDDSYFVFYSYKRRRYEVHSRAQRGSTLAVVLPFDRLDQRSVDYVNKTRSENAKRLFAEMEKHNADIKAAAIYQAVKQAETEVERALSKGGKNE